MGKPGEFCQRGQGEHFKNLYGRSHIIVLHCSLPRSSTRLWVFWRQVYFLLALYLVLIPYKTTNQNVWFAIECLNLFVGKKIVTLVTQFFKTCLWDKEKELINSMLEKLQCNRLKEKLSFFLTQQRDVSNSIADCKCTA